MQIYEKIARAVPSGPSAVALGFFDGLHIGHAAVIGQAVRARKEGLSPCVFTFTMHGGHPAQKNGSLLLTERNKYALLEQWGIDTVLTPDFSEFHEMSPEAFVDEILVRRLQAKVVCCGEDFRFGKKAGAGVEELKDFCDARDIRVCVVPAVLYQGERVSSSRIRQLLEEGEVKTAAGMLGRAFGYDFTVVHGKKLGRTIDSPTINQRMPENFAKLRHGVYASVTIVKGTPYPSVTNIGLRPTVEDSHAVNSETYIHGFSGDLYGKRVEVRLLGFLRGEQKFPSVDALRAQIQRDITASLAPAREYIADTAENFS